MNEKMQRILDQGLLEFSNHSFEDGSLNKIIENANVSKGTFYHYFKDKMHLYLKLVSIYIDKKAEFVSYLNDESLVYDESDSFFDTIKKQTHINIKFLEVEPEHYKFSMMISAEPEDIKTQIRDEYGWRLDGGIDDMIEIGYLKGEFDTKYPKGFIKNIVSHLSQQYYSLLFPKGVNVSSKVLEVTLDLYLDFIKEGFASKK
jgi:TetR/AcrR family transcriptional regulator